MRIQKTFSPKTKAHSFSQRTTKSKGTARIAISFLLLIILLMFISMACTFGETYNWAATMMTKPTATSTIDPESIIGPEDIGKSFLTINKKEIVVIIDPLQERDMTGVETLAQELDGQYLIETSDPEGRYLPSVGFLQKDREPEQEITLAQIDSSWEWSLKTGKTLDTWGLTTQKIGTTTLGEVHNYLRTLWTMGSINMILPISDPFMDSQRVDVYRTPGPHTVLLLPAGTTYIPPGKMASPRQALLSPYLTLSFLSLPPTSITAYIHVAENVPVTDYSGINPDNLEWAQYKVLENREGLAQDYIPPRGISEETVYWINYDPSFVYGVYYVDITQESETCTDKKLKNRVIRQSPEPGSIINAVTEKITLYVCEEVVSQSKYETLTFKTNTPTITGTPLPTSTTIPTSTQTPSITPTLTRTTKPSSTPKPSSTSTRTVTATTAVTAATTPSATEGPSLTPTITNTPLPNIKDLFITSGTGYDTSIWTTNDAGSGSRTWRSAEQSLRQEVQTSGDLLQLVTNSSCLLGEVEFRIKSDDDTNGSLKIGWNDSGNDHGIFVQSDPADTNNTRLQFITRAYGIQSTNSFTVPSNTEDNWHIYRITWSQNPSSYVITAALSVDGTEVISTTTTTPEVRLNFVMGIEALSTGDINWLQSDYVMIFASNCQ
ncbi:MAG: PASTA domain-containing protein [Anaerolineaceae bacterium]|nr:PASTA domain-containing protein [Anaerolineaceae bacterium]